MRGRLSNKSSKKKNRGAADGARGVEGAEAEVSLEQHAKTEKAKTLGEIVTETNLKYAGKKQCDVKSAWLPVGEQEKWVREKLLVEAQQQLNHANKTCPFSYETCVKYAKICRDAFKERGDASLNDCPIAVKWQEFRDCLFIPKRKKRTAMKRQEGRLQRIRDLVDEYSSMCTSEKLMNAGIYLKQINTELAVVQEEVEK